MVKDGLTEISPGKELNICINGRTILSCGWDLGARIQI